MMPGRIIWVGVFALLLLASSCDSGGAADEETSPTESQEPFGAFQVELVAPFGTTPGFTSVLGKLNDGPTPSAIIWEEAASSGFCTLLTPRVPFCEQGCGSDALCVEDGQCQAFPAAMTAGTVVVEGLQTTSGATSFSMDPVADNYQLSSGTSLPYPAFAEGDDITFTASGNASTAAFTMTAQGISPLDVANDSIELVDGQPALLEWTPPNQQEIADIAVTVDISFHGGTKGKIECEAPDTGSLELAAPLLDQLKALGFSGWPTVEITRRTIGTTDPGFPVELAVEATVTKPVEIPGLISCDTDDQCPAGQTCQADFRCQ